MNYAQFMQLIIVTAVPSIVLGVFLSSACRWLWRMVDRRLPPRYLKRSGERRRQSPPRERTPQS